MNAFRVLILDDDAVIRRELVEYIASMNILTFQAGDPAEAYDIIGSTPIDLVLLDLVLEEEDGFQVLKTIREKHPGMEVMVISGLDDANSSVKALQMGATDFFSKPFDPLEIRLAIERIRKDITDNK
jgi:DNA-binding response OmpR family regulator